MENSQRILALTSKALLVLMLSSPIAVILLALQSHPTVPPNKSLTSAEIVQIEQLLLNNVPQNVSNQGLQEVSLSDEELNLLLRYAGEILESEPQLSGRILLPENSMLTEISIPLTSRIIPAYLNLSAEFTSSGSEFQLSGLKAGYIRVPGNLVNKVATWLDQQYLSDNQTYIEIISCLGCLLLLHKQVFRLNIN